jgi:hypothetical protein
VSETKLQRHQRYKLRKTENDLLIHKVLKKGCLVCGEKDPNVLDFHHVDPKLKKENVKSMSDRTEEKVLAEIEKCVILCANCHRRLHRGVIRLDM